MSVLDFHLRGVYLGAATNPGDAVTLTLPSEVAQLITNANEHIKNGRQDLARKELDKLSAITKANHLAICTMKEPKGIQ